MYDWGQFHLKKALVNRVVLVGARQLFAYVSEHFLNSLASFAGRLVNARYEVTALLAETLHVGVADLDLGFQVKFVATSEES
jgi:hypothetical protein